MPREPSDFKPVKVKRTFEVIVDMLRNNISSGELRMGDRLPSEREMAQMVEVSRNTVRQAYHILNLLGIVEITKGATGGAVICEPSHRPLTNSLNDLLGLGRMSLKDITEARMFIEQDIIELVFNRFTDADLQILSDLAQQSLDTIDQGRPAHRENLEFHRYLSEIAANPVLKMVYASVLDLFSMILETTADIHMSAQIAREHVELVELLRQKDLQQLLCFTEKHIRGSNERLMIASKGRPILTKW